MLLCPRTACQSRSSSRGVSYGEDGLGTPETTLIFRLLDREKGDRKDLVEQMAGSWNTQAGWLRELAGSELAGRADLAAACSLWLAEVLVDE